MALHRRVETARLIGHNTLRLTVAICDDSDKSLLNLLLSGLRELT